jgi:hypothetical protein
VFLSPLAFYTFFAFVSMDQLAQAEYCGVRKRIDYAFSLTLPAHNTRSMEDLQMFGHIRLVPIKLLNQFSYAAGASCQQLKNTEPKGLSQHMKPLRNQFQSLVVHVEKDHSI